MSKKGLGRGLGALIPGGDTAANGNADRSGLAVVPVTAISPNPHQPRTEFDSTSLHELAESIREHGLIQPLIVNKAEDGRYTLIAGERRWRAAQMAGLSEVPVVIKEATPQHMLELALIENIQRADLNPLEEALAYQQLMDEFGLTQAQVAQRVGKSRSTIANIARILTLPAAVKQAVLLGTISGAHGRTLASLPTGEMQLALMNTIIRQDLSVRQAESIVRIVRLEELAPRVKQAVIEGQISDAHAVALVQLPAAEAQVEMMYLILRRQLSVAQTEAIVAGRLAGQRPQPKAAPALPPELAEIETRFRQSLGTRVTIQKSRSGGKVIIHYYSDEELHTIYEAIVGEQ
jgi:ParB family transcriptional regulator, chromosome partitioning protein